MGIPEGTALAADSEKDRVYEYTGDGRIVVCVEDSDELYRDPNKRIRSYCHGCVFFNAEESDKISTVDWAVDKMEHLCTADADTDKFTGPCSDLAGVWREVDHE